MILLDGTQTKAHHGTYQLTYTIGTGTAKLQQSVDGQAFQDVPLSSKTSSDAVIIDLCMSEVKSVLTGDAVLSMCRVVA